MYLLNLTEQAQLIEMQSGHGGNSQAEGGAEESDEKEMSAGALSRAELVGQAERALGRRNGHRAGGAGSGQMFRSGRAAPGGAGRAGRADTRRRRPHFEGSLVPRVSHI
jgi:hypothetical protein